METKISERLGRLFTGVLTKEYWVKPFPSKYHDECFMCNLCDCSAKNCDKYEKEKVSDRLEKEGLM